MRLLRTIATAVVRLSDVPNPGMFTLPYPEEAQRALDRMVLACLERGAMPPTSVPDLLLWCRQRHISSWPLDLPEEIAGPEGLLIDPDTLEPTRLCYEWQVDAPDSATELYEREHIGDAIRRCREAGSQMSYVVFRRRLIEHPIVHPSEGLELVTDHHLAPVYELLRTLYQPIPARYMVHGTLSTCARCRIPLIPTRDRTADDTGLRCEQDRCRHEGRTKVGAEYPAAQADDMLLLARPLRIFVSGPGRAELRLEANVRALGLEPELWPGFDAYDLRIPLPDGRVWAIEIKDWAHPALLGRKAKPIPRLPDRPHDRAVLVVPRYRWRHRQDYRDVFSRYCPADVAAHLELRSDTELLDELEDAIGAADDDMDPGSRGPDA